MKIVKYIFLLLLLSAIAITVFIATQTGSYDIREEKVINIPKNVLYGFVNDYSNWDNIKILTETDSTTVYTVNDSTSGAGAAVNWRAGEHDGRIQTVRTTEFDSIVQNAYTGDHLTQVYWMFKDTLNATKVSVRVKGQLTFTEKAYALLQGGAEERYEKSLANGLANLKNFLVNEINNYSITFGGEVVKKENYYIGYPTTSSIKGINQRVASVLPRLRTFVQDNKMETNGRAFILYSKYDRLNSSAAYTICIPLKEEIFTAEGSEFMGGKLSSFPAFKTTLKGDYSHLREAWNKTYAHLNEKGPALYEPGQYVEVYSTNTKQTKQPSKWVTDIYFPLGKAANDTLVTEMPIPETSPTRATLPVSTPAATPRPTRAEQRNYNTAPATPPAVENRTEEDEE